MTGHFRGLRLLFIALGSGLGLHGNAFRLVEKPILVLTLGAFGLLGTGGEPPGLEQPDLLLQLGHQLLVIRDDRLVVRDNSFVIRDDRLTLGDDRLTLGDDHILVGDDALEGRNVIRKRRGIHADCIHSIN